MVRRKNGWLTAKIGDELVMMSAEHGNYVGLTHVGARIWELIEEPKEIDDLCGKLCEEFDVSAEACRADVDSFLSELANHGAILLDLSPAA